MKSVWKYEHDLLGAKEFHVLVPTGGEFVYVGLNPGHPANSVVCVWAVVDPDAPKETRALVIIGTGHPVNDAWVYIGSVVAPPFAWHVFEDKAQEVEARD